MGLASIIYLDDPTHTTALDTTKPHLGAPGRPGELRFHVHEDYGFQVYQLRLNESGGALVAYDGVELAATTVTAVMASALQLTIAQVSDTGTICHDWGGVPQVAVADDEWCWCLIEGTGLLNTLTLSAKNAVIECAAAGDFDDTSGTGLKIGKQVGATVGTATTATAVTLTRGGNA